MNFKDFKYRLNDSLEFSNELIFIPLDQLSTFGDCKGIFDLLNLKNENDFKFSLSLLSYIWYLNQKETINILEIIKIESTILFNLFDYQDYKSFNLFKSFIKWIDYYSTNNEKIILNSTQENNDFTNLINHLDNLNILQFVIDILKNVLQIPTINNYEEWFAFLRSNQKKGHIYSGVSYTNFIIGANDKKENGLWLTNKNDNFKFVSLSTKEETETPEIISYKKKGKRSREIESILSGEPIVEIPKENPKVIEENPQKSIENPIENIADIIEENPILSPLETITENPKETIIESEKTEKEINVVKNELQAIYIIEFV
jgi:hypothetical protein